MVLSLLIPCDLSFAALEEAFRLGSENSLGKVSKLLISPEDKEVARDMLLMIPTSPELEMLPFEVNHDFPPFKWQLLFDKGVVESQGPN